MEGEWVSKIMDLTNENDLKSKIKQEEKIQHTMVVLLLPICI